ncbi:hypothetical protein K402DRAFT_418214 [Aulographum hederae CBS 113979]|uniref:Fucose-specific lectin n=1 Tax=Aulographum hederae CBS 113979 TaxID=1176131 RepID=A0A6G1HAU6_9PEZI|nr:hypothetical protein K402DRAFT_418214 [Aulographum hederae CBS 113979]
MASKPTPAAGLDVPVTKPEQAYSSLEVDQNQWLEHQNDSAPEATHSRDTTEEKQAIYFHSPHGAAGSQYPWPGTQDAPSKRTICGLRRSLFYIILSIILLLIIGGAIGGAVGATRSNKSSETTSGSATTPGDEPPTPTVVGDVSRNTGLAALQWINPTDAAKSEVRVYYQDAANDIRESTKVGSSGSWTAAKVMNLATNARGGTSIAVSAGYLELNMSNPLTTKLNFVTSENNIAEWTATSIDPGDWVEDQLSDYYEVENTTVTAYWNQNFQTGDDQSIIMFQNPDLASNLTMIKTIGLERDVPWVPNRFLHAEFPLGSSTALAPTSAGTDLMLYASGGDGDLVQYNFQINNSVELITLAANLTRTGMRNAPNTQFGVLSLSNYTSSPASSNPACSVIHDVAHLILFPTPDQSSLNLYKWTCASGFDGVTETIASLLKPDLRYMAVAGAPAAGGTGRFYVLLNTKEGNAPRIEEWTVPAREGEEWGAPESIEADFAAI